MNEETKKRVDTKKDLNTIRAELTENRFTLEQKSSKLNSTLEIHRELSNKLKSLTFAKSRNEEHLSKMIRKREFTADKIRAGTKNFSGHCRIKCSGDLQMCIELESIKPQLLSSCMALGSNKFHKKNLISSIHKQQPNNLHPMISFPTSAMKVTSRIGGFMQSKKNCKAPRNSTNKDVATAAVSHICTKLGITNPNTQKIMVKVLSRVQHPHLVAMMGFCKELKCIVFEYMHQNCLRNVISSNSMRKQCLNWHARVDIAAKVCSSVTYLHLTKPKPMIHGSLNLANILLDCNNVAKLHGFRLDFSYDESDIRSDIQDFGSVVLELLTGRKCCGSVGEVLDQRSGDGACKNRYKEMEAVQNKADVITADVGFSVNELCMDMDDQTIIPSSFVCPILKDIMEDPHIASDGFSYELSAIKQWLGLGYNTSPMTNLALKHNRLTPNHTLRSLIQDWRLGATKDLLTSNINHM
ncbi:U-box domain-containing protein kinase family protein [Artemisia annua]|uniref:RING-type E3 ubiquitin transferase n=1 Tax=Artemisia annua TaxID=35608 RepID=A0A2U1N6V7_ARTAN|nr:U-box domain-containing protein kinase family protein [Artemisia annua]